ncbi:MAG: NAD(P)H-hydrate dehydratase, partial [Myxococcota bacterium]|nr:NAD(P)H-hydrate dehydratase [Myxococcota bacterium]
AAGEVLVVCGMGNNGGDGFVVARHLHLLGVPVRLALLGESRRLRKDAAANARRARTAGLEIGGPRWRAPRRGVIVDAIFGTGLSHPVDKAPAASVRRIAASRGSDVRVVALDMPSGICADTGQALGDAVRADVTVTFGLPKIGLALEPGREHAGRVVVARIGIVDETPTARPDAAVWTRAAAGERMPARPPAGHKGRFGHALVVAGSEGKTGAAALAADAAARVGAGLVTVACPAGVNEILEVKCTEAMTAPLPDTAGRALAAGAEDALVELAAGRSAVGMGPGLGGSAETAKLVRGVALRVRAPLALDADALHPFAASPELLRERAGATLLTPHPGEAAALLGGSARELNRDRPGAARCLAERTGAVVLLKGAGTVIASPDGALLVNPNGGPALGSGGTGDVLLGMAAGLLAQGLNCFDAAALAAFWHGFAADRIAERTGPSGLLAGDLAGELPEAGRILRAAAVAPIAGERLALAFPEP